MLDCKLVTLNQKEMASKQSSTNIYIDVNEHLEQQTDYLEKYIDVNEH